MNTKLIETNAPPPKPFPKLMINPDTDNVLLITGMGEHSNQWHTERLKDFDGQVLIG